MKKLLNLSLILLLIAGCQSSPKEKTQATTNQKNQENTSTIDYTNLPLGDNMYSSSPKKGYVYSCQTQFNGGGAFEYGPWINQETKTWDLTQKIHVDGSESWSYAIFEIKENETSRTVTSHDLPTTHTTGTFPIASNDDAYNYDRNPNSIKEQSISFEIPKNPTLLSTPECVGGEVGIATTGVLIFNAFDAAGRDAVAVEVQDHCEGHPQAGGFYHYHGYSSCFEDNTPESEHSELLGYAFDGFGIYGIKGEDGKELTSEDLDECHGHTAEVEWNGEMQEVYHYHFTQDFPYTVSCFKGKPSVKSLSYGEEPGSQQSAQPNQPPKNLPPKR